MHDRPPPREAAGPIPDFFYITYERTSTRSRRRLLPAGPELAGPRRQQRAGSPAHVGLLPQGELWRAASVVSGRRFVVTFAARMRRSQFQTLQHVLPEKTIRRRLAPRHIST